jgi:succinate dehydrogenase/fumarate reductase flavoprotein subunit
MLGHLTNEDQQPVHLLCDSAFLRKYAFGAVAPLASERRQAIRSGYLIEAATIDILAKKIGVEFAALRETIARVNRDAEQGLDTEFNRGSSAYNRYLGDATHRPNPCVGEIKQAPFYAIRVYPGDIGTIYGLAADQYSRVLDTNDCPIEGLYACGNDRNSIMGGFYPSGGITIGPALTFAYLAVLHAHSGDRADQPKRPARRLDRAASSGSRE